jgi:hypothetical protein
MTLIGIPVIFILISIFEMARGMWVYHTLASAVSVGARYASVHGQDCSTSGNSCNLDVPAGGGGSVHNIAQQIENAATGLDPAQLTISLCSNCGANTGYGIGSESVSGSLTSLLGNTSPWPSNPLNGTANSDQVYITVKYPFKSALAMFWPMGGNKMQFGSVVFVASAQEVFHF